MSGMAELLYNHGFKITGSDINKSERTLHLNKLGIKISTKHKKENINTANLIVYSSAVKNDNPEIIAYMQVKNLKNIGNDEVFVFNGWTFSSSPTLRSIDHPVYDLWLVDCDNV